MATPAGLAIGYGKACLVQLVYMVIGFVLAVVFGLVLALVFGSMLLGPALTRSEEQGHPPPRSRMLRPG